MSLSTFHQRQLKEFGGADGIRNRSGLEAAVESPKATFDGIDLYPTIFLKAAAYAYHLAESQAFVDGNKRAALYAFPLLVWLLTLVLAFSS